MQIIYFLAGLLFHSVVSLLSIIVSDTYEDRPEKSSNPLSKIYSDFKDDIYEVTTLEELSPSILRKYGVAKIKSTDSVIFSQQLAKLIMDPYAYLSEAEQKEKYPNDFIEVSFEEMDISITNLGWANIGSCQSNAYGLGDAALAQGWALRVGDSVTFTLGFPETLGFTPSVSSSYSLSYSIGGTASCTAGKGKTVQFQIKTESYQISGVKQRRVPIRDKRTWLGILGSEFDEPESWKQIEDYERLNPNYYELACVTDEKLLRC